MEIKVEVKDQGEVSSGETRSVGGMPPSPYVSAGDVSPDEIMFSLGGSDVHISVDLSEKVVNHRSGGKRRESTIDLYDYLKEELVEGYVIKGENLEIHVGDIGSSYSTPLPKNIGGSYYSSSGVRFDVKYVGDNQEEGKRVVSLATQVLYSLYSHKAPGFTTQTYEKLLKVAEEIDMGESQE